MLFSFLINLDEYWVNCDNWEPLHICVYLYTYLNSWSISNYITKEKLVTLHYPAISGLLASFLENVLKMKTRQLYSSIGISFSKRIKNSQG